MEASKIAEFKYCTGRMMDRGLIKLNPAMESEEQVHSKRMADAHQEKLERKEKQQAARARKERLG